MLIRVKNAPGALAQAVQTVRSTSPESEIVIVDNMSTDETYEVALRLGDIVFRHDGHLGGMRRPGVERSTRPIIFFMDADQRVLAGTIASAAAALRDAEAVVVPERPLDKDRFLSKVIAVERAWAEASGMGIPRVFWRDTYLTYRPPDGILFGEDRVVGEQVKRIRHSTVPILHDEPRR